MKIDPESIEVHDNPAEQQYEALVEGKLAFAAYQLDGNIITFTHTEVPEELAGGGVAGKLVRTALDDVRARGLEVVPLCPFVVSYIRRHPAYVELVLPAYRERVERPQH